MRLEQCLGWRSCAPGATLTDVVEQPDIPVGRVNG